MTRRQRLGFLALAAVIAVAAIVILSSGGDEPKRTGTSATPTRAADATKEPQTASPRETPTPDPGPLLTGAQEREIDAVEGETIRFRVRSDEDDEVHVHGYDIEREVPAGTTIRFSFKATITGIFEVEFHHSGAVLARVKVEPR